MIDSTIIRAHHLVVVGTLRRRPGERGMIPSGWQRTKIGIAHAGFDRNILEFSQAIARPYPEQATKAAYGTFAISRIGIQMENIG